LDALGDNQVEEKISADYTAIKTKKKNFKKETPKAIMDWVYQFIYVSPEIFLNNCAF